MVLPWRQPRSPVAVTLVLVTLAAVSPAATPVAATSTLWLATQRRLPVAVGVAGVGVLAQLLRGVWRPDSGLGLGWWFLLVAVSYAALVGWGAMGATRHALIASLTERARRAEAEQSRRAEEARMGERTRIAREMHDVLAHRLSLLATYAGAIEFRPDAPTEELSRAAGVVRDNAHRALDELREVIDVLRHDGDAPSGSTLPTERPQPVLADLPALVEESRQAGVHVDLDNRVTDPAAVAASAGRTAYRVVQEGLTNARKHAAGRPVRVRVEGSPGSQLTIEIANSLVVDPLAPPTAPGSGTGLVGLAERVHLAGGELDHETNDTGEFRLRARIPWPV